MARLDGNDLDAIRAKPAKLKGNAAPVIDLDDLDAVRAEIARLRDQRCRISRQLQLLRYRRCRLEPRQRSARRDAVDAVLAEYAAYHAASAPVVAATPVPKNAGKTVGEAAHAAEAWMARAEALRAAYGTLDAGMLEAWEAWRADPDGGDMPDELTSASALAAAIKGALELAQQYAEIRDDRRAGNRERVARHRASRA
jgi:hypothetical protein